MFYCNISELRIIIVVLEKQIIINNLYCVINCHYYVMVTKENGQVKCTIRLVQLCVLLLLFICCLYNLQKGSSRMMQFRMFDLQHSYQGLKAKKLRRRKVRKSNKGNGEIISRFRVNISHFCVNIQNFCLYAQEDEDVQK